MLNANKKKRSDRGSNDSTISPAHILLRAEESKMAASPTELELLSSPTKEDEPSLKKIHELLTVKKGFNSRRSRIKNSVERNGREVSNLKDDLVNQNNHIVSLENQLTTTAKYVREHAEELDEIQTNLGNLEQYSWKKFIRGL